MEISHASSDAILDHMVESANARVDEDPKGAFEAYWQIVELKAHPTAMFNLAVLYAQGRGTKQDFLQAAYWFDQAAAHGDSMAGKLRDQSTRDYLERDLATTTPWELYLRAQRYSVLLYPREEKTGAMGQLLYDLGAHHLQSQEYAQAAIFLRTAAEYYNHGWAQNYLGVLYNLGHGVEQNDLAAMYWFDRAADNGIEEARTDREGILHAYYNGASGNMATFLEDTDTLSAMCTRGDAEVPQDYAKAQYWKNRGEQIVRSAEGV